MRGQRDDMRADRDHWREQSQASQKQLTDQRAREPQSLWRWLRTTDRCAPPLLPREQREPVDQGILPVIRRTDAGGRIRQRAKGEVR